jgi:hypothetical protein
MKISINNIWLTNDGVSDLRAWSDAHDVRFNGRQVVQEALFLRAVAAEPLARGNAANELQFSVTQQHASVAAAAAFALSAFGELPASGMATAVCGAAGETPVTVTFTAVLAAMPVCSFRGTRTDVTFVLRGGAMSVLPSSAVAGIDGAAFTTAYSFGAGGTVDGGGCADALSPAALMVDGGALGT